MDQALQSLHLPKAKAIVAVLLAVTGCSACLLLTPPERWLAGCVLSMVLAWAAMIDIDRMILPNLLTLPLTLVGLANAALAPVPGLVSAIIGAGAGYAVFLTLGHVFSRILMRPALGRGDAKLMAAAGAWLGWEWLPYVTLIASASALTITLVVAFVSDNRFGGNKITFGPYIALGITTGWFLVDTPLVELVAPDFETSCDLKSMAVSDAVFYEYPVTPPIRSR